MIINILRYIKILKVTLAVVVLAVASSLNATGGLRIALLGDSMTWIGGDSCQNPAGWSHYLKESGLADCIDVYARSGATWTNTSNTKADTEFYSEVLHDDNVIYNQVLRLIDRIKKGPSKTPDLIIVYAGANDAWFANRRPGIFNTQDSIARYTFQSPAGDATTLQKSVALSCDLLKESFPDSSIILVTPIEMSKVSPDITAKVSEIIEETAQSRGIQTLRADRTVAIRHSEESATPKYTTDGVHTNAAGAYILSEFIIKHIPTNLQQ